jgi:hypothetical protein
MGDLPQSSSKQLRRFISPAKLFTLLVVVTAGVLWPFSFTVTRFGYITVGLTIFSLSIASMTGIWSAIARPWWRYIAAIAVTSLNSVALMFSQGSPSVWLLFLLPFLTWFRSL